MKGTYIRTDKIREKMSLTHRGSIPWNKGRHWTKKEKLKLKISAIGKHKINKGSFKKGQIFSIETRKKMAKSHTGLKLIRYPWNKGKKLPQMSGKNHPMYGKKYGKEQGEKIGNALRGRKLSEQTKKRMRKPYTAIRKKRRLEYLEKQFANKKPTGIEKKVYDKLKSLGILFETQKLINGRFIVDAYIPSLNLVIEVDGNYWHTLPKVVGKDKAENAYLTKCGYKLLRLSEQEINNDSYEKRMVFQN